MAAASRIGDLVFSVYPTSMELARLPFSAGRGRWRMQTVGRLYAAQSLTWKA